MPSIEMIRDPPRSATYSPAPANAKGAVRRMALERMTDMSFMLQLRSGRARPGCQPRFVPAARPADGPTGQGPPVGAGRRGPARGEPPTGRASWRKRMGQYGETWVVAGSGKKK